MAKKKTRARKSSSLKNKSLRLSIDLGALEKLYKRRYDLALDGDTKGGSINVLLDGDTKGGSIRILDGDGDTKGGGVLPKPGQTQERAARRSRKRK